MYAKVKEGMMDVIIQKSVFKRFLIRIVLRVLGNAVEAIDHIDMVAHKELSNYKEGCIIAMKAFPDGRPMCLCRKDGYFSYSGNNCSSNPDYLITFKSIDNAFSVLLGLKGIEQAFIEHRFSLEGDLMTSLPLVRALGIVEAYLFPTFMLRNLFLKIPTISKSKLNGLAKTIHTMIKNRRLA